jgi:hypothetical protein
MLCFDLNCVQRYEKLSTNHNSLCRFSKLLVQDGAFVQAKMYLCACCETKNLYNILENPVLSFSIKPETIADAPR